MRLLPVDSSLHGVGGELGDSVLFAWTTSSDEDGDTVTYILRIDSIGIGENPIITRDTTAYVHFPTLSRNLDDTYPIGWKVRATDTQDTIDASNNPGVFILDVGGSAGDPQSGLPTEFALSNYPNPFNPVTELSYVVQHRTVLNITVYDVLGRITDVSVKSITEPGTHTLSWSCASCGSGVYFFVLSAEGKHWMQKAMLIR